MLCVCGGVCCCWHCSAAEVVQVTNMVTFSYSIAASAVDTSVSWRVVKVKHSDKMQCTEMLNGHLGVQEKGGAGKHSICTMEPFRNKPKRMFIKAPACTDDRGLCC